MLNTFDDESSSAVSNYRRYLLIIDNLTWAWHLLLINSFGSIISTFSFILLYAHFLHDIEVYIICWITTILKLSNEKDTTECGFSRRTDSNTDRPQHCLIC
jgi:hypothetical protein